MRCVNCQKELSDRAAYCPDCGLRVQRPDLPELPDPTMPVPQQTPSSPVQPPPASSDAPFVPASFDAMSPPAGAFAASKPASAPVSASLFDPSKTVIFSANESDYYHIDATETPDFEAMRGISIVLIIASALSFIGILFPMPLAIVSLVKACTGAQEVNPTTAKRRHETCRRLVIITAICIVLVWIAIILAIYALPDILPVHWEGSPTAPLL